MGHGDLNRKLSRTVSARKALFRSLATALVQHKKIQTTHQKAKEIQRVFEKIIRVGLRVKNEGLPVSRLEKYFYRAKDFSLIGREKIHHFVNHIQDGDQKKEFASFIKDPQNSPRPNLVVDFKSRHTKTKENQERKPGAVKLLKLKGTVNRFMEEVLPRLGERKSGYLKIFKLGARRGDNAKISLLALASEMERVEAPASKA